MSNAIKYVWTGRHNNGHVWYKVGYGYKEVRYDNSNVPKTVKKFIYDHFDSDKNIRDGKCYMYC